MLAQYIGDRHDRWDEKLDEARFAINTAHHECTGYSPAYLKSREGTSSTGATDTGANRSHAATSLD